jgi:hypothetical protein
MARAFRVGMKIRITGIHQIQLPVSSILAAGIFQQTESSAKSSDLRRTEESCHKVKPARLIRKIHIIGTDLNHKTALMIFFASVFMQFPGLAVQSVDLAWNPSTNATVTGYNIYSGTASPALSPSIAIDNMLRSISRLLSENQHPFNQVSLYDVDGIRDRFSFSSNRFNASAFSSLPIAFSYETVIAVNSTSGSNLSDIARYEIRNQFLDPGDQTCGSFDIQALSLHTIKTVPERAPVSLAVVELLIFGLWYCFKAMAARKSI